MHEELAGTGFVVIGNVSVRVRTDVYVEQEGLAVFDETISIFEVCLALANRLDFSTAQGDARFVFLQQKVMVAGGPVLSGVALAASHRIARARRLGRAGAIGIGDHVAALARHCYTSLNLHRSIGQAPEICARAGSSGAFALLEWGLVGWAPFPRKLACRSGNAARIKPMTVPVPRRHVRRQGVQ